MSIFDIYKGLWATLVGPNALNTSINTLVVNDDGSLNISGSISASTSAVATAAAPSYIEGSTDALSMNLGGALRVAATIDTTGLATSTLQTAGNTKLDTINTSLGGLLKPADTLTKVATVDTITNTVTVTGPLTNTQLRATPVPVSGTVAFSNTTLDVTNAGTFAVQAAATLAAETTKVIGTVNIAAGQTIGVTGPLTDTQLRASAVPVSLSSLPNSSNFDVALSTRLKPADTLTKVTTVDTITNPVAVTVAATLNTALVPLTSGGCSVAGAIMTAGTNATTVKGSAGQVFKIECFNNSANIGYLKLYNSGSPTAGSGTPVARYMVPANGGFVSTLEIGDAFGTGIGYTFTGGIADADTTAVAANAFLVNIHYK